MLMPPVAPEIRSGYPAGVVGYNVMTDKPPDLVNVIGKLVEQLKRIRAKA
jgi:hypothetical protein